MTLYELMTKYASLLGEWRKTSIFKRIFYFPFRLIFFEANIMDTIASRNIYSLLKEYRIMYLGLYGKNKTYNPLVSIYESLGYNCLDIYIKHKYVIKFRFNLEESYISIDGKYPNGNKVLRTIPEEIEEELRFFIIKDIEELFKYLRRF